MKRSWIVKFTLKCFGTLQRQNIFISAFGSQWKPVVIDSIQEYYDLRAGNSQLRDIRSFWVNGSANYYHGGAVLWEDYIPNGSGNSLLVYSFKAEHSLFTKVQSLLERNWLHTKCAW